MSEPVDAEQMERILAPFEGAACGEDLRLDLAPRALYSMLRDARAEARAEERLAEHDPEASGNPDGWRKVERLAIEALASRSKDVEIACWLTESLVRRCGLPGLAQGATVLSGLISQFWEGLFPSLEEDDPAARLASIGGLSGEGRDGTLLQPLRRIVLFERNAVPVTLWQYDRSREVRTVDNDGKAKPAMDAVPFDEIEASAKGPGKTMLSETIAGAKCAVEAWHSLENAIADAASNELQPSTGRVRNLLESLLIIGKRHLPAEQSASGIQSAADGATAQETDAAANGSPALLAVGRDVMLDNVLTIANAFRSSEPNSPFSYTIEEAVRRARLTWPELLREVVPEPMPRAAILSGLGIRTSPE